jgi:hypothetical protein
MENSVHLTCILAHRDDNSFYVNSENCFVQCIGVDTSEIPLHSYLRIIGHLCNSLARNIMYTVVFVERLEVIP